MTISDMMMLLELRLGYRPKINIEGIENYTIRVTGEDCHKRSVQWQMAKLKPIGYALIFGNSEKDYYPSALVGVHG